MPKLLLCIMLISLVACSAEEEPAAQADAVSESSDIEQVDAVDQDHAEIAWFDGTVEAAFAKSAADGDPLFLYWGAVWCPPCQEIKHTVFKSQEFINLSRLFIPVYLDGDTDQAQAWGETFGVMGYPTMIIFNSAGDEVTRIPGGIDIERYNSVLALSLNQMKPTAELIQLVLDGEGEMSADDYYQLAYYSWGQDTSAVPEGTDKAELFDKLATNAPAGELQSRFYMRYLIATARNIEEEEAAADVINGDEVAARLTDILGSQELTLACWDSLAYSLDDVLEMPIYSDAQQAKLETLWTDAVFNLRHDASLSKAEKLGGWLPKLYFATRGDALLPEPDQALLRQEMTAVDKATPDAYERQSVISTVSYLYRQAGMKGDAKSLLVAELAKSASPYYFMSSLASMAEKDGEFIEAIDWRRQAWETATGQATRFQWGTGYVRSMVRMAPQDVEKISQAAMALLAEFPESHELFAGRNFRILKRLNRQLTDWAEEQETTEFGFSEKVEMLCDEQAVDSQESENCRSLFSSELAGESVAQAS